MCRQRFKRERQLLALLFVWSFAPVSSELEYDLLTDAVVGGQGHSFFARTPTLACGTISDGMHVIKYPAIWLAGEGLAFRRLPGACEVTLRLLRCC